MSIRRRSSERGFTMLELLITMAVMVIVLAGTMQIMSSALRGEAAAMETLDMNSHLRAAMDLMQRDMLQVGQGLPVGRRIGIPNGDAAEAIARPGSPRSGECAGVSDFPLEASLPAVTVGPDLGPPINGQCTDVITILAADNLFGPVPVAAISANGRTATIHDSVDISDDPDVDADNLRAGDLLMIVKGGTSVLMQITEVEGQVVTFGSGDADPLGLNQVDASLTMDGTINRLRAQAPIDPSTPVVLNGVQQPGPSLATRIRMVTYFVDITTDPRVPRLVRAVGGAQPTAVGMGVQDLRFTYDLTNLDDNPTDVPMNAADLAGTSEKCANPCSENQIRKVNILLAMTGNDGRLNTRQGDGRQAQNALYTQVSLRSMAFVDRYR